MTETVEAGLLEQVIGAAAEPIVVGADPQYPRIDDIRTQLKLLRPETNLCHTLHELAQEAQAYFNKGAVV